MSSVDGIGVRTSRVQVEKWDDDALGWVKRRSGLLAPEARDFHRLRVRPYEVIEQGPGNQLLDTTGGAGASSIISRLITTNQVWDQTHCGIAVGDSATGDAATQTDLQAATNKWYEDNDASFPALSGTQVLQAKSSFGASDGNFAWNEWIFFAVVVGTTVITPAASLNANWRAINRKAPAALGTKSSGVWTLTIDLTFT